MINTTPLLKKASLAFASVALLASTAVHAETRATSSVRSSVSSSKSSTVSSAVNMNNQIGAPNKADIGSMKVSELPYCGGEKTDSVMLWDSKAKKWACKSIAALMPPKCDGADQALRFDGTGWKCEVVGGLIVGHTAAYTNTKNKKSCDQENTWGGATCTLLEKKSSMETYFVPDLKCPTGTLSLSTWALSGYETIPEKYSLFGDAWHMFCLSKPIKIAK